MEYLSQWQSTWHSVTVEYLAQWHSEVPGTVDSCQAARQTGARGGQTVKLLNTLLERQFPGFNMMSEPRLLFLWALALLQLCEYGNGKVRFTSEKLLDLKRSFWGVN